MENGIFFSKCQKQKLGLEFRKMENLKTEKADT